MYSWSLVRYFVTLAIADLTLYYAKRWAFKLTGFDCFTPIKSDDFWWTVAGRDAFIAVIASICLLLSGYLPQF